MLVHRMPEVAIPQDQMATFVSREKLPGGPEAFAAKVAKAIEKAPLVNPGVPGEGNTAITVFS